MLRLIKKDAYQKAVSMTPDELAADTELIKELKDQHPYSEDTHYVIEMSKLTGQHFDFASRYMHNVLPFHEALYEECVFEIKHICDTEKPKIPLKVADWYNEHYYIERQRRTRREKNARTS